MGILVNEPGRSRNAGTGEKGPGIWSYIVLMVMPLAILLGGLALLTFVMETFRITAEIALVFVIGLSVIALLLALSTTAIFFSWVRLTDRNSALGLPDGSIRAVIALSLIVIFAIMAIYLYNDVASRPVSASSETAQDLAQQVLTTVSTLVVAVAGFYFGTSAVKTAQGATARTSLRIVRPKSPHELKKENDAFMPVSVSVATTPLGAAINWDIEGDPTGTLVQNSPGEFTYTPGDPSESATLVFSLVQDPDVSAAIELDLPPA